mmetsp:Transcript_7081/g.17766  ORF Transcript_7081/g.17766 Transcript_7081/m.17766 type:complete len:134 (-) Transcript_7081:56-457(-)
MRVQHSRKDGILDNDLEMGVGFASERAARRKFQICRGVWWAMAAVPVRTSGLALALLDLPARSRSGRAVILKGVHASRASRASEPAEANGAREVALASGDRGDRAAVSEGSRISGAGVARGDRGIIESTESCE